MNTITINITNLQVCSDKKELYIKCISNNNKCNSELNEYNSCIINTNKNKNISAYEKFLLIRNKSF
jgi:hypothetical protein